MHSTLIPVDIMTTWTLIIPMTPPSANLYIRHHWATRAKLRDEWHLAVWALCNEARVTPLDICTINCTVYFKDQRRRDEPNFRLTLDKLVLDGLVRCGIIPDDDPSHVTSFVVTLDTDKGNPRTEISITTCNRSSST